ncbi:peptidase S8/S53 domain-containing protein [Leptodontidium sp. MPI-SDFR-AT-0119]|nr:peptidase S8/S53 domain-containing protein [Leptodontidium sp. MPI-SDFR-AT-0119]
MGLLQLLCDVLPAFVAVANYAACDEAMATCREELEHVLPENFYLYFSADLYAIRAVLDNWDWGKEPDERQVHKILDVLESRLLSTSHLERKGWVIHRGESFPKLQSLSRILRSIHIDDTDDEETEEAELLDESEDETPDHEHGEAELQRIRTARSQRAMSAHERKETRLSLTTHRRFDLTPPSGGQLEQDDYEMDAKFEILLPTKLDCFVWQETEVLVRFPRLGFYSDVEKEAVQSSICDIIERAQGTRLRMMIEERRLWQLRVEPCTNMPERKFNSLEDLLQDPKSNTGISISTYDSKQRLTLSYILATSLLHLHSSHWLRKTWQNENICFHVESLGIMLLEIARGRKLMEEIETSELRDGRYMTSKTDGLVALRVFEEWVKDSERTISKTIPLGLKSAIQACLEPTRIPATMPPPSEEQIRHYIFTYIVAPLGTALSETYSVPLENLHQEIISEKPKEDPTLFDSIDKKHTPEQVKLTKKWFEYQRGSHGMLHDVGAFPQEGSRSAGRVTVAVLDTGFQPSAALMETYQQFNRIRESKSWVKSEDGNEDEKWDSDQDGHGTQVAELFLRVAPVADIHVAKVFETRRDLVHPEMASAVHQRIADAIDHATKVWKVDIIIMSFGFDSPVPIIRHALQRAVRITDATTPSRTSTLIFAATRNDGANKDVAWPARANEVIGISSTDGNGTRSSFNPADDHSSTIFYALGEAVEVICPPHMGHKNNKTRLSGTSFANPIAAGLAANILGYIQIFSGKETCKAKETDIREILEVLKSKDGMKAVLQHRMSREGGFQARSSTRCWKH